VVKRLTGVDLPRPTLDREAKRQGQRAERTRDQLDEQMRTGSEAQEQGQGLVNGPFTLVLEIDAWNIRERDGWGQTERERARGVEPERWHWVYAATSFRLVQCPLSPLN
jgi:hypothetical protein